VARPSPAHMAQGPQACERVMRTVYLPTSNVESLLLKCESLQAQVITGSRSGLCATGMDHHLRGQLSGRP
jgi:hypothetical protein